tara:strand:- start:1117 stop:2217 length:1101 start_codon:yes stop_codon:yes gene_type:complete
MAHAMDELLNSSTLSEEVRSSLSEAWETQLTEARESITAELREEFAQRYENDKSNLVEAADKMITDVISKELEEFKEDKAKVAEDRVAYRKHMKEHAKVLDQFVMDTLGKEIKELRQDRVAQDNNMTKLEGFVMEQLTKELNEFHEDKRSLVEAKVKMIKEGKEVINQTKADFIKTAAKKVEGIMENTIKSELNTLREDIKTAKENTFGRKIFETFAAEFMSSYLNEGTEVAKLNKVVEDLQGEIENKDKAIAEKEVMIAESEKQTRIAKDTAERKQIMQEMMQPLSKDHKEIMGALLESVKTDKLQNAFNKYLPSVLKEDAKQAKKKVLSESTTEITGNKAEASASADGKTADIVYLQKLAGIKN